ncbi:DNA-binding response regulator [Halarcobacter ebronensis]|uniref:DNA-binding response regulator n=1 Tax=Halarcobacter ebronensis TaxID=1462615 RepID=A0A4V1LR02_9BACT|nr:response regulator [Halarcobacter ebronensis]RXJ66488.1 DNA-binding response regulator [Halarcobacter ebronensis]
MEKELLEELKQLSILCVEDEEGIRKVIVDTLKYYFDEVYEAKDGNEAYELYEEYKPKIVLTDIQMKSCNGVDLVKKIRKNDSKTAIIMLTAYSNEEYLMDLINLNINHYILKPLNAKKLNEALFKLINTNSERVLLCEELVLDLKKRELIYKNEEIIPLRKREKEFLHLLYEKRGSILSYYEIESELWTDKEMTTHALKSFIKELRAKLPVNVVKNVSQEGYTLI